MPQLAEKLVVPTKNDVHMALEAMSEIDAPKGKRAKKFTLTDGSNLKIDLSENAFLLLVQILKDMAKGSGIMIMPVHAELTTQQAADFLNVSRPFLIGLLEDGQLPFRTVGRHRRVRLEDILNYKKSIDQKRLNTLDALSAQAQELNMGYSK
jgi:excisionase family DNA binding protein